MATVQVRYIVNDVDAACKFYCEHLGFTEQMRPAPIFAMLTRGDLRLVLSKPSGQNMGGWNRFTVEVDDLEAEVERMRAAGVRFRGDIIKGTGGNQALAEDPSGNPIEIFQPMRPEARLEPR